MAVGAILGIASFAKGVIDGNKSADRANSLSDRSLRIQEEQLEMAKEDRTRWNSIYGPIEDNMGEFFANLTPDYFASQGLEAYQKDFQQQTTELQEYFAANEIDSGTEADLMTKTQLQGARDKAKIRADAPFQVQEMKQKFLSLGVTQKSGVNASVANATNSLTSNLNQQSSIAANSANVGFDAASQGLSVLATEVDRRLNEPKPTANEGAPELE